MDGGQGPCLYLTKCLALEELSEHLLYRKVTGGGCVGPRGIHRGEAGTFGSLFGDI
jgi:hypothetical protein